MQPAIERRAGERHQVVERSQKQLVLAGKRHAALHHLAIVTVVTKDKSAVHRQPVLTKAGQAVRVAAAGQVPALAHVAQVGRVK